MKRYQMTAPRYFDSIGFVKASPELPVVIELGDDIKPGPDMREIDKDGNVVGGSLVNASYAVRTGHHQSEAVAKPFDATVKKASGMWDGVEYREEGKRVKDQPADAASAVIQVERVGEAPKSDDDGKRHHGKHHKADDKK